MKPNIIYNLLLSGMLLLLLNTPVISQTNAAFTLQQLIDTAMKNSRLLSIKNWQLLEKKGKLKEDAIKKYPGVQLDGGYQYNFSLPDFVVPAGTIGSFPDASGGNNPLPDKDQSIKLGDKNVYNAGINIYQPITQLLKINAALEIDKKEIQLTEAEKAKLSLQIQLAVEKLYYGILIAQKQALEATLRMELAKSKLKDAQNALQAGQTISANLPGLEASLAEEEQHVLQLNIQVQDYMSELANLTDINTDTFRLEPVVPIVHEAGTVDDYKQAAVLNPDWQIANLNREKALLGIKANRLGNLPDIGLMAGYNYQHGNPLLPSSNPYVGISFKWNLQDLFSNAEQRKQREFQLKQAEDNLVYTQQQINSEIEKAWRKIRQANMLIEVAQKAVRYRKEGLKVQEDKQAAGMDVRTTLLESKARLAKSEADLYASQLSLALAVTELKNMTGKSTIKQ